MEQNNVIHKVNWSKVMQSDVDITLHHSGFWDILDLDQLETPKEIALAPFGGRVLHGLVRKRG